MNPYKWPKINGFHWVYGITGLFHPEMCGVTWDPTEINCMTLGPPTLMFVCFGQMFEATHLGFGRVFTL